MSAISVRGLTHRYAGAPTDTLTDIHLDITDGSYVALMGPSGCGKSTLLSLLAGLLRPSAGEVWIGDEPVHRLPERRLLQLRATTVAVVLQSSGQTLLPYATVRQNLAWVRRSAHWPDSPPGRDVDELLDRLFLTPLTDRPVAGLSGGEQQRVALAASLVHVPSVLLVDEPTSQLDETTRDAALALLDEVRREAGATMLVATHDPAVAERADQHWRMRDGHLAGHS
jgi:ABC-type lipoprotein export system ATPase subunit